MSVRHPYLIQRAKIKTRDTTLVLSRVVDLDYMGAAEFEFGALPKSLRRIEASLDKTNLLTLKEIKEGKRPLRVFSYFSPEEVEEYTKYLQEIRENKRRLKEPVSFSNGVTAYGDDDFWWDIENDAMFSFDQKFMNNIQVYLKNSLALMNKEK